MRSKLPDNSTSIETLLWIKNIEKYVNNAIIEKKDKKELLDSLAEIHKQVKETIKQEKKEAKELKKNLSELFNNK